jgi:hypothetical protein
VFQKIFDFFFKKKHVFKDEPTIVHTGIFTKASKLPHLVEERSLDELELDVIEITYTVYRCQRCKLTYALSPRQIKSLPRSMAYCKG